MKQHGRKSVASLQIVPDQLVRVLPPPEDLTEPEVSLWRAITESKPSDWFTVDSGPLLAQYVRHVTKATIVAVEVNAFDPEWLKTPDGLKRYEALCRIADKESRALATLGTRLRLTPQSKIMSAGAATTKLAKTPTRQIWER